MVARGTESVDVHGMRKRVTARDKSIAVSRPIEEGVKYICERYNITWDSGLEFIRFLHGIPAGGEGEPTKHNPTEVIHKAFDPTTGTWINVPDDEAIQPEDV